MLDEDAHLLHRHVQLHVSNDPGGRQAKELVIEIVVGHDLELDTYPQSSL